MYIYIYIHMCVYPIDIHPIEIYPVDIYLCIYIYTYIIITRLFIIVLIICIYIYPTTYPNDIPIDMGDPHEKTEPLWFSRPHL